MCRTCSSTASALKDGSETRRHDRPSPSTINIVAALSRSTAAEISRAGGTAQHVDEPSLDVAFQLRVQAGDFRVAAALGHDLGAEAGLLLRALDHS